ncbi:MAG: manganese ABC transporter permease [Dehalococcoidia bacterium]|nr:manganese ABC transporter permease [Dehalococcoidia bacterium]
MVDWLLDPYDFAFMRRALLVLLVISVVGGVVGAYVVHKGLAFSGDALAHSTLAGVAVAFVSGGNVSVGALGAAVVTALGIGWTRERARVSYDTAIGILFVAMFSLGILILSRRTGYTPDLMSFVFGNILGVSRADLVGAVVLGAGVLLFVAAAYRELLFVAYDPAMAATSGIPSRLYQYAMLVMIAVAVVVALKAIGIVLVNAMLIIPAATASLLVHRLPTIMLLGIGVALVSSVVGLHLSYYGRVAASPAIVLAAAACFIGALGVTSWRARRIVAPPPAR